MKLKLYYTPKSRALRVRWLLEELKLPYELKYIDLFGGEANTPEYKKIQPHGLIPAIEIDGNVMFESCAICHWLTDQYPDKKLAPELNSVDRQQYEQWMFYLTSMIEPPLWENFLHSNILPSEQRVADIIPWNIARLEATSKVLNDKLGDNDYLVNNTFSTVDIVIGSMLMWSSHNISDYPSLTRYAKNLSQREAYSRATAD